ncbi:GMC oxidoreductase [Rhizobium sp.]|jgi:hypothetical protein|uniref:GMC oxidoreductase n=1 Tax=Rhizobium sp. TaxID=391 RepID=UPI000E94D57F|nr:hypothetical protein [Rhizobium sp.]
MTTVSPPASTAHAPVLTNLAAYYFQTLESIRNKAFDYIVIGGGAYGTAFAHRILELDEKARVLILEKGTIFFPDHAQNLPATYVDAVYGPAISPWVCTPPFTVAPQQPYVGGRALFWNAWVPQPRSYELPDWPESVVRELDSEWFLAGQMIGRRFSLASYGNNNESLNAVALGRLFAGASHVTGAVPLTAPSDLEGAFAIGEDVSPNSFAKYAPVTTLVQDIQRYKDRLSVVPLAEVMRMDAADGRITTLHLTNPNAVSDVTTPLNVGGAHVILANNTLEAASLALTALPDHPLLGQNLSVHNRSALTMRIPVKQFPEIEKELQVCSFYQLGQVDRERFYHAHISVVYNPYPHEDRATLYRVLPDASSPQSLRIYTDPDYVYVLIQTLGEVLGERSAQSWNNVTRVDGETVVTLEIRDADEAAWKKMDAFSHDIAHVLAAGASVEYQQADESWTSHPPANLRSNMVFHEAGTLWMGEDPATSVTDLQGRVHALGNLWGTGGMLFPSPGSWNPTFTGIAMTFRLARHFANAAHP